MFEMRMVFKAIVALVITAIVPIVVFFLIGYLIGMMAIIPSVLSGEFQGKFDNMLINFVWWVLICMILVGPFSFGHVFLLGLPTLLISWHFRAIRWWSTLISSIMIGAIPSTIDVFFFQNIGWDEPSYFYQNIGNILSLGITAGAATIMGFFGLCGGFIFWLLWRYWVSPNSPEGCPLSSLHKIEIKPSSVNE